MWSEYCRLHINPRMLPLKEEEEPEDPVYKHIVKFGLSDILMFLIFRFSHHEWDLNPYKSNPTTANDTSFRVYDSNFL